MKMSNVALALSGVVFGGVLLSSHASAAEGRLVVYCSAQNTMCEQETMAFEKKYGIKPVFIRGGTGTILAKIDAEKANPQGMYGMAVRLIRILKQVKWALLEAYKSPNLAQIPEQFRDPR